MNRPYYSLNAYYKNTYGHKVYKVALDGGFSCPNRDGTLSRDGCIFCSGDGSGSFTGDKGLWSEITDPSFKNAEETVSKRLPIHEQLETGIKRLSAKIDSDGHFIAYFQSFSNTYGPSELLEEQMDSVLKHPRVIGISIATRPDCLSPDMLQLLEQYSKKTDLTVELGLQTIHPKTADFINRCYPLSTYDHAMKLLEAMGIKVVTHMIIGLPGESSSMILDTARHIGKTHTHGIKLHLLHILKNTKLADYFEHSDYNPLSQSAYIDLLIDCIEILPSDMVIHRMTGDGPKSLLIAPLWSGNKRAVLNAIHHRFKERNTWQGRLFKAND